jgi:cobalt-zinc-cadmium efflux system membrane fusion protein
VKNAPIETTTLSLQNIVGTEIKRNDRCSAAKSGFGKHSTGGYLKSSNLLPGMPVSKGQVIAVMKIRSLSSFSRII